MPSTKILLCKSHFPTSEMHVCHSAASWKTVMHVWHSRPRLCLRFCFLRVMGWSRPRLDGSGPDAREVSGYTCKTVTRDIGSSSSKSPKRGHSEAPVKLARVFFNARV